jgi:hypothetical protein
MVTIAGRVPAERILAEARQVQMGRLLLSLLLGVFYAVGWVGGKGLLALAVLGTSVKLGWQDARGTDGRRGAG